MGCGRMPDRVRRWLSDGTDHGARRRRWRGDRGWDRCDYFARQTLNRSAVGNFRDDESSSAFTTGAARPWTRGNVLRRRHEATFVNLRVFMVIRNRTSPEVMLALEAVNGFDEPFDERF